MNNISNNETWTDPCGTPWPIGEEEEVIPSIIVIWFSSLRYDLSQSCDSSNSVKSNFEEYWWVSLSLFISCRNELLIGGVLTLILGVHYF